MYTSENLKEDLLANVKGDNRFTPELTNMLSCSEFKFNDSSSFSRIIWNTYQRDLIIFCSTTDKQKLEKYKQVLYKLCYKIHGTQESYIITSLEIIAKSTISSSSRLTKHTITIKNEVIIDRENNQIGHGGFGEVYKYYDNEKSKLFAYKIYAPNIFQNSEPEIMKNRFLREGKKLLSYSHTNVVKAFDYGFLGDESAYIKMEYISGQRLFDFISKESLTKDIQENLCHEYISGMAYVHSKTDMHRDISYSNIMVDSNTEIKILDFGFARNKEDSNYDTEYRDIARKFVIPNEPYTFQTEIFCIGAILYTIITKNLFDYSKIELLDDSTCDSRLIEATKICLNHNPEQRFKNACELEHFLYSSSPTTISTNNFSLDVFRNMLVSRINIVFEDLFLPAKDIIRQWIEKDFKDLLEAHTFLTSINLISTLKTIPKVIHVESIYNDSHMVNAP